jgi:hypothetical protein
MMGRSGTVTNIMPMMGRSGTVRDGYQGNWLPRKLTKEIVAISLATMDGKVADGEKCIRNKFAALMVSWMKSGNDGLISVLTNEGLAYRVFFNILAINSTLFFTFNLFLRAAR